MKINKVIILCVILPAWTFSACGTGTLHCQSDDVPSICDFTENYVLKGDKCEVKKVDGCEIASFDSSNAPCFLCEKGKVLDENSEVCVNVDSEKVVTNCFRYDKTSSDCIECDTDYFLDQGACRQVGNIKVANCAIYSTITQCKMCDAGYYLVENECVEIKALPNCRVHTNRKCSECKSNYFLNLAYNSNPMSANVATFDLFATGKYSEVSINLDKNTTTICQKVEVKHCKELETAKTCKTCESDYFLTSDKKCQRFPEPAIPNCIKYSSASDCEQCAETHYVKKNDGNNLDECVLIPTIVECSEYDKTNGFCKTCNEGFWLNETLNSCVERNFKTPLNCQTIDPKADKCKDCKTDFSKVVDESGCFENISNCVGQVQAQNIEVGSHICPKCENKFYLENQKCKAGTINNCKTYLENKNACDVCEDDFYINEARDTCTQKNIDSCDKYLAGDENKCEICQNLKYPNNSGAECADITNKTDCYKSNGKDNDCAECITGKIRTGAGVCTGDRTSAIYDSNCAANTSTSDDSSCSSCKDGFINFTALNIKPSLTQSEMDAKNCYKINTNGTDCLQCKDGFWNDSGNCTADASPSTTLCARMKEGANENIASPGTNCENCKPNLALFKKSDVCTKGENFILYLECESYDNENQICQKCTSGNYPINTMKPICGKETTASEKSTIQHCSVMNGLTKCAICNKDFVVSDDGSACEDTKASKVISHNNYDLGLNQKGSLWRDDVANCTQYTQVNEDEIVCTQCDASTVGIIDTAKLSSRLGGMTTGNELYNPFKECVDKTTMYQLDSGTSHVAVDKCKIGFRPSGESVGYLCLRCVDGEIGKVFSVTKKSDGAALDAGPYTAVGDCAAIANNGLKADYSGVSSLEYNIASTLSSNVFQYTNCTAADEVVFYMVKWDFTNGVELNVSSDGANPNKLAFCGKEADVLNVPTAKIDNCAIYTFSTTVPTTFVQGTTKISNFNCQSCKPGFYAATKNNSGGITSCEAIHGCNTPSVRTSDENSWLNGCSNPDSGGWKIEIDTGSHFVSYFDPMPNSAPYKIDNCLALLQSEEKCLVCKPGFMSNGSACVAINSANSNCTTPSMGLTLLNVDVTTNSSNRFRYRRFAQFSHIRQLHSGAAAFANNSNSLCQTCDSGTFLLMSDQNYEVCGKRADDVMKDANCASYSNSGCTKCNAGYALNGGKCKAFTKTENCVTFVGDSCSVCDSGYKYVNGKCVNQNCEVYDDSNNCIECKENMRIVDKVNHICEPNSNSNDDCLVYSPHHSSYCIKCKDSTKLPYNINYISQMIYSFCVSFTVPNKGWSKIDLKQVYVHLTSDNSTIDNKTITVYKDKSYENRTYNSTNQGDPAENLCIPTRTVTNCSNLISNIYCSSCSDNKFLSKNNACVDTPIANCNDIDKEGYICNECVSTHYLAEDKKSCISRTNSTNCNTPVKTSDTCTDCKADFVMNSSNYCVAYTAVNCKTKHSTLDKCEWCVDNAWMDQNDGDKCKLSEDAQCILMKKYENECQKCSTGFYLKTEGLVQTCVAITATNCSTNKTHSNECETCKDNFYLKTVDNLQQCVENTEIDFCTTYSKLSDDCKVCNEGYYSSVGNTECRKYPTGILYCTAYSDETTCTQCAENYYLSEKSCVIVPNDNRISDCLVYDSDKTCSECKTNHFLTNSTKCDEYDDTVKGKCLVYESHEKCKSCIENYILNEETKLCEPSGIAFCKTASRGSPNLCEECVSGYFTSSNKQSCQSPSTPIENCLDYETQTKCKKCKSGFLLSLNSSKCLDLGDKAGINCDRGLEVDKLQCDVCEFGYVKNEIGECVKISENYCAFIIADKCGLCFPKMKMNKEGKCENPNSTPPDPGFVSIVKLFTYLLVMLTLIK